MNTAGPLRPQDFFCCACSLKGLCHAYASNKHLGYFVCSRRLDLQVQRARVCYKVIANHTNVIAKLRFATPGFHIRARCADVVFGGRDVGRKHGVLLTLGWGTFTFEKLSNECSAPCFGRVGRAVFIIVPLLVSIVC